MSQGRKCERCGTELRGFGRMMWCPICDEGHTTAKAPDKTPPPALLAVKCCICNKLIEAGSIFHKIIVALHHDDVMNLGVYRVEVHCHDSCKR